MKIGDVVVGETYGALDAPGRRSRFVRQDPRRVKVLEIVTVEENYWPSHGFSTVRQTRNVRRVKIELLDDPQVVSYSRWDEVAGGKKGANINVEARLLVGLWSKLAPDITKRIKAEEDKRVAIAGLESRVKALIGRNEARFDAWGKRLDLKIEGNDLEKLLALAEKGKEAS